MSHPVSPSKAGGPLQTARMLSYAMAAALVWIAVALYFVAPPEERWAMPEPWVVGAQLLVGAMTYGLVTTVGFRAAPLPAGLSAERATTEALTRFQSGMMLRLALGEVTAILSVALMFVLEPTSLVVYLVGAAISLAMIAYAGFPRSATILKVEASLDRGGARSGLAEALGVAGGPGYSAYK